MNLTARSASQPEPAEALRRAIAGGRKPGSVALPVVEGRWRLVREMGLEYAEPSGNVKNLDLCWPIATGRTAAGLRLVVDDPESDGSVPVRLQCRTTLVAADDRILFDTRSAGIPDGYGCLMDSGHLAILRRTRWDILLVKPITETYQRIDLSSISKLPPRLMCWTGRSFLIAFVSDPHILDLAEVDLEGRLKWHLPTSESVGMPGSMQLLPNDSVLVADEFRHVVQEIGRAGSVKLRWGEWANPARDLKHLSSPKCARQNPDGKLIIADTNNHRLLVVDGDQCTVEHRLPESSLIGPTYVESLDGGGLLVCDGGNQTVVELDRAGAVRWRAGKPRVVRRWLSFPRSVQSLGGDHYLVADTAANRLAAVSSHAARDWPVHEGLHLFWPRAAYRTVGGTTLVADGRHSRVVELDDDGRVLRVLKRLQYRGRTLALVDPHDVRPLASGHLLIVDSAQHVVLETTWKGEVQWLIGAGGPTALKDPHSAQVLADGHILVSDPGNHRVLIVEPHRGSAEVMTEVLGPQGIYRLYQPRYAEASADGTLVIVDTGNNRILACDRHGRLAWELSTIPGSPIASLKHPRWASLINRNEVLVSDHFHHRILHLRRG